STSCTVTVVAPPTCQLTCNAASLTVTGTISGGTPPYSCNPSVTCPCQNGCGTAPHTGWTIDNCLVSGSTFSITYHVDQDATHPACGVADFSATITDNLGCQGPACTSRCTPTPGCNIVPGNQTICSGGSATLCVTSGDTLAPFIV